MTKHDHDKKHYDKHGEKLECTILGKSTDSLILDCKSKDRHHAGGLHASPGAGQPGAGLGRRHRHAMEHFNKSSIVGSGASAGELSVGGGGGCETIDCAGEGPGVGIGVVGTCKTNNAACG